MNIGVYVDLSHVQLSHLVVGASKLGVGLSTHSQSMQCEIMFGNPESVVVSENGMLQWLQLESVGFSEYLNLNWERRHGSVIVTNLANMFSDAVAESALAGVLSVLRGIDRLVELKGRGEWVGDKMRSQLRILRGAHVVMFGHGAINKRLEELLVPFGCKLYTFSSTSKESCIEEALVVADVVFCAVPATPATQLFFGSRRLALLRPSAVICNFGRGSIIDEEALANALDSRSIGGAVLDVTAFEPLPPSHRFWTCANLVLTQHTGGGTIDELDRKLDLFLANLVRFCHGSTLENVVNFSRGY